jgi:hypothetical protein
MARTASLLHVLIAVNTTLHHTTTPPQQTANSFGVEVAISIKTYCSNNKAVTNRRAMASIFHRFFYGSLDEEDPKLNLEFDNRMQPGQYIKLLPPDELLVCCCFQLCIPKVRGIPAEATLMPKAEQLQLLEAMKGEWKVLPMEKMEGIAYGTIIYEKATVDGNRLILTGGTHLDHHQDSNGDFHTTVVANAPQVLWQIIIHSNRLALTFMYSDYPLSFCMIKPQCRFNTSNSGARRTASSISTTWVRTLPNILCFVL